MSRAHLLSLSVGVRLEDKQSIEQTVDSYPNGGQRISYFTAASFSQIKPMLWEPRIDRAHYRSTSRGNEEESEGGTIAGQKERKILAAVTLYVYHVFRARIAREKSSWRILDVTFCDAQMASSIQRLYS